MPRPAGGTERPRAGRYPPRAPRAGPKARGRCAVAPRQVPPAGAQWRIPPPLDRAARQPRHGERGLRSAAPRAGGAGPLRGRQSSTERRDRRAGRAQAAPERGQGEPRRGAGLQPHHGSLLGLHRDPAACCSCSGPFSAAVRHLESQGRGRRRRHRPEGDSAVTVRCAASRPQPAPSAVQRSAARPALRACAVGPSRSGLRGGWGEVGGAAGRASRVGGGKAGEAAG